MCERSHSPSPGDTSSRPALRPTVALPSDLDAADPRASRRLAAILGPVLARAGTDPAPAESESAAAPNRTPRTGGGGKASGERPGRRS